ncbi:PAS domain-containing protein [Lactobacillus jensenii]|uniref:PAS domain-containing protein n=1 Tax=Lactobacillus jensenii TaxID=109790 RepID=UPI001192FC1D|nr:PAS domain-containing protein [Lactobacillus jensenii]MDK7161981.1 PAS domain-containing protein [Lactobacillus jensenii]TVV12720.1 oxidoreductase [Lactobacillus jensenii]
MAEPKWLKDMNPEDYLKEDFDCKGKGKYTISGIENDDPEWLDKAAKKVNAAEGDDYVKLDCGLMTVNQLNWMLRNTFGELTFVDENNQFLWYNRPQDPNYKMKAKRVPAQVGDTMGQIHPDIRDVIPNAKKVVHALRTKEGGHDDVYMPVPTGNLKELVLHYYKRVEDEEGNYRGIYEWVQDLYPFVKYFCETTGQKLVVDPDATTGATYRRNSDPDAKTGASTKAEAAKMEEKPKVEEKPDTTTGASEH